MSKKIWDQLIIYIPQIARINSIEILEKIVKSLESNSYDDRVAGANALKELCESISEDQIQHPNFIAVLDAIMKLIEGKYFNNKEQLVECMIYLVKEDFLLNVQLVEKYLAICCAQVQKVTGHYNDYKNALIKSVSEVFKKTMRIKPEIISELFDCLILELTEALEKVVVQS